MGQITTDVAKASTNSYLDDLLKKCRIMMNEYWAQNPDLYAIIKEKRKVAAANDTVGEQNINSEVVSANGKPEPLMGPLRGCNRLKSGNYAAF